MQVVPREELSPFYLYVRTLWQETFDRYALMYSPNELDDKVSEAMVAMAGNTAYFDNELRSHIIHYQLDKLFPRSIKRIDIERRDVDFDVHIAVVFNNNHVAHTTAEKIMSGEFIALCSMLYQLPDRRETND